MEEKGKSLELAEPRDAIELVPAWEPQLWWFFAGAAVLAAVVLAAVLFLRKKPAADPAKEKREAYLEAKAALSGRDDGPDPRESAIRVSMVLRRYLARSMGEPALFETHEEFVTRHDALKELPEDLKSEAGAFFAKLAAVKYAPDDIIPAEAGPTQADGAALLERIHGA